MINRASRERIIWTREHFRNLSDSVIFISYLTKEGVRGGAVVEALRYKPEGRGIYSR
jgi:hypothetical protein